MGKEFTQRQKLYAHYCITEKTKVDAAKKAGYKSPKKAIEANEKNEALQEYIKSLAKPIEQELAHDRTTAVAALWDLFLQEAGKKEKKVLLTAHYQGEVNSEIAEIIAPDSTKAAAIFDRLDRIHRWTETSGGDDGQVVINIQAGSGQSIEVETQRNKGIEDHFKKYNVKI